MEKFDAVIVGGGIIGASVAYQLAKKDWKVGLVEKDHLCAGATGACNGGISYLGKTGKTLEKVIESLQLYRGLEKELGLEEAVDQERDMILLGKTGKDREALLYVQEQCRHYDLEARILSGAKLRSYLPAAADSVKWAGVSPAGIQGVINPFAVTLGYMHRCLEKGGKIVKARARGLEMCKGTVESVITDRGEIPGEVIVNCMGAHADLLWKDQGISMNVYPVKGVVMVTQQYPRFFPGNMLNVDFLKDDPPEISLAIEQTIEGNILVGASKTKNEDNVETTEGICERIAANAASYIPGISGLQVIRSYAGLRPVRDEGYFAGRLPGTQNLYGAVGFGGAGIALAPWAGKYMAHKITQG